MIEPDEEGNLSKKHIGASVFEDIKQWEKDPAFKKAVKEHVEKAKSRANA